MLKASIWCAVLGGLAVMAKPAELRTAAVSGQATILERPGDLTEDLGNVVVFLEPASVPTRLRQPRSTPIHITLRSRQFSPRVRVVTEGSKIEFPNEDPFSHNVFSKMNGGFDTGVFGRGQIRDNVFKDAGIYPLYCNIHPRMTAFVVAVTTPYYAQADADGRFVIDNVPAGEYRMHVWHDRATAVIRNITVPAATNLRVEMDARAYRYVQHKNKFGQDYTSATGDRY